MFEWEKLVKIVIDEIDNCINNNSDEAITLTALSGKLGYSEFYTTKKFKEITGMKLKDYVRFRKLAFALKEVRDSKIGILDIAVKYGFSSHEAFTHSFKDLYGITPSEYRKNPIPIILRTKINPFDRYFLGLGEIGMIKSTQDIKIYFVTLNAHKFLHISNSKSIGYWDFWEKQSSIPGQDCETICGLLDSIKDKLDDYGSPEINSGSGQIMGYINDPTGRVCSWGIPLIECYGVRLATDYDGVIPNGMKLIDIPEGEYIVFEHGPFDYEQENRSAGEKIEKAMDDFSYDETEYIRDTQKGRIGYLYHDPQRFFKYVFPVKKKY